MIRKKIAVAVCVAAMAVFTGCGGQNAAISGEMEYAQPVSDDPVKSDTMGNDNVKEESTETDIAAEDEGTSQTGAEDGNADKASSGGDELDGTVVSVDADNKTVVMDKVYMETDPETGLIMVHNSGGMVRVYFRDDVRCKLETVTDNGGNVETREADFSDIQEGDMLHLKGKEAISEQSGDEFLSAEVTIVRVRQTG